MYYYLIYMRKKLFSFNVLNYLKVFRHHLFPRSHSLCVPHLEGGSLCLRFQDVTLQILWGAQWSGHRAITACAAQTALLCDLHNILL